MTYKVCLKCDSKIPEDALYCEICGARYDISPLIDDEFIKFNGVDLELISKYALIFALTRIGVIFSGITDFLLTDILNWAGLLIFIYGLTILTKDYPRLASGKQIITLFKTYLILDILNVGNNLLHPHLTYFDYDIDSIFLAWTGFVAGMYVITTLLLTYSFREWFDGNFHYYKKLNSYCYYGILTLIGNLIILVPAVRLTGFFIFLVAGIIQVYAGFEIYSRLHKMSQAYKTSTYYPATEELSNYI